MTHLESFVALYKSFGVVLYPVKYKDGIEITIPFLFEGEGKFEFKGEAGATSLVEFDLKGKFVRQSFWLGEE